MTYPSWTADLNAAEASFETYIETSFYRELQDAVAKGVSPIFLEGPPGSGKTTLLWMLQRDHTYRQQSCAFVGLRNVNSEGDFFQVIDAQLRSSVHYPPADGPTVVSSSSDQLARSVMTLIAFIEPPPLLLLDGLDEAFNPYPALRMVRLITQNTRARVVVTCRPSFRQRITGDSSLFHFLSLPAFTNAEASELLRRYEGRFADQQDYETIAALAGGNPLLLKLLVHVLNELPVDSLKEISLTKEKVIKLLLKRWISLQATEPHVTSKLVHTMGILALRGSLSLVEARALLGQGVSDFEAFPLVRSEGDTLFIAHAALRPDLLALANAFPAPDTRLKDLDFGAEAAERDSRLADNFLEPPGIAELRSGRKTIVVGDRGSGKSALFSAVTSTAAPESSQAVRIIAMKDPAGFLQNLESNGSQLSTAEQFRAAWLLAIAHSLATQLGELDSAVQAKMAARLRKAIPEGNTEEALGTLEWLWMRLRHSSVKFSLGPIVLESSGRGEASGSGRKAIDVASFLRQTARSLRALGRRAIVAVDRVDEVHKYDRERQERLVQGLFLAEGSLVDTPEIQCLIFVRTDLFELYDIQEKNKLVSRSIWLRWDRKDLLRMLINRVLATAVSRV